MPPESRALLDAARREYLTPRRDFGPSDLVGRNLARTTAGVYLQLAPHLEGEPVHSVGWARNDFWAVRLWSRSGHACRNDNDPQASGAPMPALETLGWPQPLTYAEALAAAKERAQAPVMVTAGYRLTDGSFTSQTIEAAKRARFHFCLLYTSDAADE